MYSTFKTASILSGYRPSMCDAVLGKSGAAETRPQTSPMFDKHQVLAKIPSHGASLTTRETR